MKARLRKPMPGFLGVSGGFCLFGKSQPIPATAGSLPEHRVGHRVFESTECGGEWIMASIGFSKEEKTLIVERLQGYFRDEPVRKSVISTRSFYWGSSAKSWVHSSTTRDSTMPRPSSRRAWTPLWIPSIKSRNPRPMASRRVLVFSDFEKGRTQRCG